MIYIGFGYDSKSWVSRAIAWFCKGKISHAFFLLRDPIFGWVVLGAEARKRIEAGEYQLTPTQVSSALDKAHSQEMQMQAGPFDSLGKARITQLINKTNQFNVTTRNARLDTIESTNGASCSLEIRTGAPPATCATAGVCAAAAATTSGSKGANANFRDTGWHNEGAV